MITSWPVPAAASSPVAAVLVKLGPLEWGRIVDLRPYFDSVPNLRSWRGRWYSLTVMVPRRRSSRPPRASPPRARGYGPDLNAMVNEAQECSPPGMA